MISRQAILVLTTILVVLTVMTAVVASFQALLAGLGDTVAARVARWIEIICCAVLCVDVLLLVGALGLRASRPPEE